MDPNGRSHGSAQILRKAFGNYIITGDDPRITAYIDLSFGYPSGGGGLGPPPSGAASPGPGGQPPPQLINTSQLFPNKPIVPPFGCFNTFSSSYKCW